MRGSPIAGALALAILAAGIRWGAMVAGGADSYGYVSQAGLWQQGRLIVQQDIVRSSPWPHAAETWSPLGYRPSPHQRDGIVPMYAPGLPLLMTLFQAIAGYCGAFLVVPLAGALTVWLTFVLGRRVFGAPGVALWGASLVATSPVFLYQLMNAMSDVPVTAFCTLALVLAVMRRPVMSEHTRVEERARVEGPFASGLAMSVAIAIRPNLAPLAVVIGAWFALTGTATEGGSAKAVSYARLLRFAAGVAPAVLGIAWLNGVLYESPFVSGYGTIGDLYSLRFFGTNVRQFATWIVDVETPVVALAAVYFMAPRLFPMPDIPRARLLLGGSLAVVILSYVFYEPFDVWWYLRFLLPMWPVLMLLTAVVVETIVRRWVGSGRSKDGSGRSEDRPLHEWDRRRPSERPAYLWMRSGRSEDRPLHEWGRGRPSGRPAYLIAMAAIAALLAWHGVDVAVHRGVFDLGRGERRYVDVGRFVASHTEPDAVMLSLQHSGSLRLYAGRLTLRYAVLDAAWLDRVVSYLQSIGRHPYFVLDGGEVEAFRRRFAAANRSGALDWPPLATLGSVVSIYDPIGRTQDSPLAIASTRGARGWWACDPPQSWPPVLRMK
jgi:hypothetical protein